MILTRLLEKAIRRSEAVDREALCVVAGEKVRPGPFLPSLPVFSDSLPFHSSYGFYAIRLALNMEKDSFAS